MIDDGDRLTVFLLPAYAPDLNPAEGLWADDKHSLANLAVGPGPPGKPRPQPHQTTPLTDPAPSTAA
ncbi:hypothetical protein V2W30_39495 (plasmid) [Streptomyces sp. Q6]|uniref:Uncharacterized protein n=1 Tax=Streptomyces citrinus TaxID=3118173 RepID=A0ACD5AQT6_9ACTN